MGKNFRHSQECFNRRNMVYDLTREEGTAVYTSVTAVLEDHKHESTTRSFIDSQP